MTLCDLDLDKCCNLCVSLTYLQAVDLGVELQLVDGGLVLHPDAVLKTATDGEGPWLHHHHV